MIYKLPIVLEPQPEGGFTVTCPLLPELITEGDTVEEVMENVQDALAAVIEAYEDLGRPLPPSIQPTKVEQPLQLDALVSVA
ncbi:MAG: type II toxin-antitoxin system HicB family antitoxin [Magnetococcales bacterium]|nr:type II toxin-antitoxin system HicB family antitoxin [Magnetococcales bacterium]